MSKSILMVLSLLAINIQADQSLSLERPQPSEKLNVEANENSDCNIDKEKLGYNPSGLETAITT